VLTSAVHIHTPAPGTVVCSWSRVVLGRTAWNLAVRHMSLKRKDTFTFCFLLWHSVHDVVDRLAFVRPRVCCCCPGGFCIVTISNSVPTLNRRITPPPISNWRFHNALSMWVFGFRLMWFCNIPHEAVAATDGADLQPQASFRTRDKFGISSLIGSLKSSFAIGWIPREPGAPRQSITSFQRVWLQRPCRLVQSQCLPTGDRLRRF
jgi:hypothetical protein